MEIVEVEFEHSIYLMTDMMDVEDLVQCIISAEVVPMTSSAMDPYGNGGSVQITRIQVTDDRFPGLSVTEYDLTSDEYDKIEDRAYDLAARTTESYEEYSGYYH